MMFYIFYVPTLKQVVGQYKIWNEVHVVLWFTLGWFTQFMHYNVYMPLLSTISILRKPQRFWYLKSYDIPSWTSLYTELCIVFELYLLFTIPEIYYDTLDAFFWGDLDHDQWSKITHMVHQRNRWIRDQRGSSVPLILILITPKKCTLYLCWTFC